MAEEAKTEDEGSKDETSEDEGSQRDGNKDEPFGEAPSEDRLEELEQEIEHVRQKSEVAEKGSFYEGDEPMFVQSGERAREDPRDTGEDSKSDDQNIAPG